MKKIVALGAAAALVGGLFAAEPASNPSVISFNGNATVKWGMDLDAGKTGFKNETWTEIKLRLFDKGDKVTSGDNVWGELKLKTDANWGVAGDEGWASNGAASAPATASIDVAKLHFGDFYVGIKSDNCTVGEYLFDTAIRGKNTYGSGQDKWINDQGPAGYTQGIVAGYENNDFSLAVDFRSLADASTQYTNAYAIAAEAKLKDSLVTGLEADAGVAYRLSNEWYKSVADTDGDAEVVRTQYGVDSVLLKAAVEEAKKHGAPADFDLPTKNGHVLGYGANASYKLPIGDYYLKPQVGFAGSVSTADFEYPDEKGDTKVGKITSNHNELAFGVFFGFGGDQKDNAGVYFLDADSSTKKATPGFGVVVGLPLANSETMVAEKTAKGTSYDKQLAVIAPSFYTNGNFVENLKLGFYSEIVPLRYQEEDGKPLTTKSNDDGTDMKKWALAKDKDATLAMAVAAGFAYDYKTDDFTLTPKLGIRYANAAYMDNSISGIAPFSANPVFTGMGKQAKFYKETGDKAYKNGLYDGDFFNLKAGVDLDGMIDNTKFFFEYASANLLNKVDYKAEKAKPLTEGKNPDTYKVGAGDGKFGFYNVKLGTFNVGCQIHF